MYWYEYVDVIYYINLDHREDRSKEFLGEMKRMGVPHEKIVRVQGVYKPKQGDWGCSLSHVNTIEVFQMSGHKNCIVFEDDFLFVRDISHINHVFYQLFEEHNVPFDMCMLSYNIAPEYRIPSTYPFLMKGLAAHTTSGYMIHQDFSEKLLHNFREGSLLIEHSYEFGSSMEIQHHLCIDQYWNKLLKHSNWYLFTDRIGIQRKSYSDIEEEITDYGI